MRTTTPTRRIRLFMPDEVLPISPQGQIKFSQIINEALIVKGGTLLFENYPISSHDDFTRPDPSPPGIATLGIRKQSIEQLPIFNQLNTS